MRTRSRLSSPAFSLIEVTLALGVAGFCLIAIFGLIPVALNSNQTAIQQTAANALLTSVTSDLRATPATSPRGMAATSNQYSIAIPASGSSATAIPALFFNGDRQKVATAALGRYRVTINFLAPPSGAGSRTATIATIKVSWPAAADPAVVIPVGFVQTFTALDRN